MEAPQVGYAALLPSLYGNLGAIADAGCATFQTKLGKLREERKGFFPREGSLEPRTPELLAEAHTCFAVPSELASLRDMAARREVAMLPIEEQIDAEMPDAPH